VTIQPVSQAIRPLRRRMLEDMAMRGLRAETQRDYVRFVHSFAAFLRRPPDTATPEDIRRFQVRQVESGCNRRRSIVAPVCADPPPRRLPTVLSVEEVGRLLELAPGPKYRAALGTAYGAG
jgi:integrase/recombinase XerD